VYFTVEEKRKAIERELAYRVRVYARMVEQGKMTQAAANRQIEIFEEIRKDYAAAESLEALL
jgi:hypothetical protein